MSVPAFSIIKAQSCRIHRDRKRQAAHQQAAALLAALDECRKRRAVCSSRRLARNVAFIANLMESGADFVAVDMPQAKSLTIHILAAVAEHERRDDFQRTKAALAQAKCRGTILGNPRLDAARPLAVAAHHASRPAAEVTTLMNEWRAQGKTLRAIATDLNRLNIGPARGRQWYASSVKNQLCAD